MPADPGGVMFGFSETVGSVLLGKLKHTEMVLLRPCFYNS